VEGTLCSSNYLHANRSRNCHVLRRHLPLLPPTPTTVAKARVRARGRGKERTPAPAPIVAITVGAPRRGPPSTILDRHHLTVARDASSLAAAGVSTTTCPACYTGVLRGSRWPLLHAPDEASAAPVVGHGPCLVGLDKLMGSTTIDQLLQHHGLDSPSGHRLGRGLRCL
jgi:hypothetical protein